MQVDIFFQDLYNRDKVYGYLQGFQNVYLYFEVHKLYTFENVMIQHHWKFLELGNYL
jgi:hypothetical protein